MLIAVQSGLNYVRACNIPGEAAILGPEFARLVHGRVDSTGPQPVFRTCRSFKPCREVNEGPGYSSTETRRAIRFRSRCRSIL